MTELLFKNDGYLRLEKAKVTAIQDGAIALDKTIFVPTADLQPNDLGKFLWLGYSGRVLSVDWADGRVFHRIAGPMPQVGQHVRLKLNWRRRYQTMRLRTAVHLIAGIAARDFTLRPRLLDFTHECATIEIGTVDDIIVRHLKRVSKAVIEAGAEIVIQDDLHSAGPGVLALSKRSSQHHHPFPERLVRIENISLFRDRGLLVKNIAEIGQYHLERTGETSVEVRL